MCVYVSGGKKCSFFEKIGVLCFLESPVFRFALLPYNRPSVIQEWGDSFEAKDQSMTYGFPLGK